MAQTSQEKRNDWNSRNLKHYNVVLRKDQDMKLIEYIERKKQEYNSDTSKEKRATVSRVFREAIERMMEEENGE